MSEVFGAGAGEAGLVSVVIPSFQRAHTLAETLDSVLAQTYRPVEILVADDGSTDETRALVESYTARHGDTVRYLYQPNAGVSAARNLGLRHARGEFVALLDSDDVWLPHKLAAQVALLRALPEVGMTWTDMTAINPQGTTLSERYLRTFYSAYSRVKEAEVFNKSGRFGDLCPAADGGPTITADTSYRIGDLFMPMLMGNLVHTSTVLMRRDRLRQVGGFDTTHRHAGEDYDYHLRTCSFGPVALLDAPTILYRIGADDQITAPRFNIFFARGNLRTLQTALVEAQRRAHLPPGVVRRRLAESHSWLGREELRAGNRKAAREQFQQSLGQVPWQPSLVGLWALTCFPAAAEHTLRRLRSLVRPRPALG